MIKTEIPNLIRDESTSALINTDIDGYRRHLEERKRHQEFDRVKEDVDSIKSDIAFIKQLLLQQKNG